MRILEKPLHPAFRRKYEGTAARESMVVFFGGGTGGHLTPGLALADGLAALPSPGVKPVFFPGKRLSGKAYGLARTFQFNALPIAQPGRLPIGFLRDALGQVAPLRRYLAARPVAACIGLGGYVSLPGILAAKLNGLPVFLMEQNAVAGRVNRWLLPWVDAIFTSFPETRGLSRRHKIVFTGNPVRPVFQALRTPPWEREIQNKATIVILGGSQGAKALNEALVEALPGLAGLRARLHFVHAAGPDHEWVARSYRQWGLSADVAAFFPDLGRRMADADLALSRAGGSTLAELLMLGIPSVLVPYPHARDDHQAANAACLEAAGAAVVCPQSDLDGQAITSWVQSLVAQPDPWRKRADNSYRLSRPDAAEAIIHHMQRRTGTVFDPWRGLS